MKKLFTFISVAVAAMSCVNADYDLANLDGSATILPGVVIPLDPEQTGTQLIPANDFMNLGAGVSSLPQGEYVVEGVQTPKTAAVVDATGNYETGKPVKRPDGGAFSVEFAAPEMPEFVEGLRICDFAGANLTVDIETPLSSDVTMLYNIIAGGKSFTGTPVVVKAGSSNVNIPLSAIDLYPADKKLTVTDIALKSEMQKSGIDSGNSFSISGFAQIPIALKKGTVFEFNYEFKDIEKELGVNPEDYKEYDAKSCVLKGTVQHSFPFSVEAEGEGNDNIVATLSKIECTDAVQDFILSVNAPNGIMNMRSFNLHIKAVAGKESPINVNDKIEISLTQIKLDKGINLEF